VILDSSAVVALILEEPRAGELLAQLAQAREVGIGAPTLVESAIVLTHRLGPVAMSLLERLVGELGVTIVPFDESHCRLAIEAHRRFGKGRHPASLNFGDCMAYATAKITGRPILSIGEGFSKTDLREA
jgi:ribonuclease VapC